MRALLLLCLLCLASCAGPPRGWEQAARAADGHPVSGAWSGTWQSSVNGHRGALQCVAEQLPGGAWEFRYRAKWAGLLRAGFTCPATVARGAAGTWQVEAQKDLGHAFGGPFRSAGSVENGVFLSTYESTADRGSMRMERVR